MILNAIDLFSGCGGLSEGLKQAGFKVIAGVEVDKNAAKAYCTNHSDTVLFEDDIRKIDTGRIKCLLKGDPLHLLAGCPPCQGFSSLRKLNRKSAVRDERNKLILTKASNDNDGKCPRSCGLYIVQKSNEGLKAYRLHVEL